MKHKYKGYTVKLHNRRVSVLKSEKRKSWLLKFKKLEEGKIVITELVLSDEAMHTVNELYSHLTPRKPIIQGVMESIMNEYLTQKARTLVNKND